MKPCSRGCMVVALILAGITYNVYGQDGADQTVQSTGPADGSNPSGSVTPSDQAIQNSREQLLEAYQWEFAFLDAQRSELGQQFEALSTRQSQRTAAVEADIQSLEARLLELRSRADTLRSNLREAERAAGEDADAGEVLQTTFSQADATFSQYDRNLTSDAFIQADSQGQVQALFSQARDLLTALQSVRSESGEFFLADGTKTQGTLTHVGNIATFGVSERGAGALVPAGGGELKLWAESSGADARALLQGQTPDPIHLFLYESLATPVSAQDAETWLEHINSGGSIGWFIVALGVLALALIAVRAFFLRRASANTGRITDKVTELIRHGRTEDALDACKRGAGSAARVMAAAIRNLDHDREHIEDIISEAVLHERAHLNRFGAFILVIAAVAPLLGLLGTVTGMINTFDVITEFGTGNPKLLSGGISVALVTTELGLIVAIPALIFGNLLSGWAERIKDDMEKSALKVINQHQSNHPDIRRQAA